MILPDHGRAGPPAQLRGDTGEDTTEDTTEDTGEDPRGRRAEPEPTDQPSTQRAADSRRVRSARWYQSIRQRCAVTSSTPYPCPFSSVHRTCGLLARMSPAATPESRDRKSTRLNSSHANISYAVFCLKKKNILTQRTQLEQ